MKKFTLTLSFLSLFASSIFAQSVGGSGNSVYLQSSTNSVSPLNVGIGTKTPTQKLHIVGNEATTGRFFVQLDNTNTSGSSAIGLRMTASNDQSVFGNLSFNGSTYDSVSDFDEAFSMATNGKSLNLGSNGFIRFYNNLATPTEAMRIAADGKIGIGTKTPTQKLHIVGDEAANGRTFLYLHNKNETSSTSTIFKLASGLDESKFGALTYSGTKFNYANNKFSEGLNLFCNGKTLNLEMSNLDGATTFTLGRDAQNFPIERIRLSKNGFGIGTETPTANLHSKGTVRMENLTTGSSFILTSDANGNLLKSTTLLTDLNATISDLKTRLATAETDIAALKKKVGLFVDPVSSLVKLQQNEPNPTNSDTKIKFFTPDHVSKANIFVFDVNGRMVKQYDFINVSGNQEITLQANSLEAGMYFYTLLIEGREIDTKKMFITN